MTPRLEVKKIYEMVTNSDRSEGRGVRVVIGRYIDQDVANVVAKGNGVMGTDAIVKSYHTTLVFLEEGAYLLGETVDLSSEPIEVTRERALAKLTDAEKKALGLA